MNHFKNAKVVGDRINHAQYAVQLDDALEIIHRGDPRFSMSRGELVDFLACPMKWVRSEEIADKSKAMDHGSLIDMLALTPELFDDRYIVSPTTYTTSKGTVEDWTWKSSTSREWRDMQEEHGLSVVTPDELKEAQAAVSALLADKRIQDFIEWSDRQVMVTADYHDHETGLIVPVRCLTDLVPSPSHPLYGKSLGDLKTAANGSPFAWPNAVRDHAYDVQAALNLDLHTAANPKIERVEFRHLIQESSPPYQTGRRLLSEQFIERGRAIYLAALKLYCKCLKHNFWPDFEVGDMVANGWTITEPAQYMISNPPSEPHVCWPVKETTNTATENYDTIP